MLHLVRKLPRCLAEVERWREVRGRAARVRQREPHGRLPPGPAQHLHRRREQASRPADAPFRARTPSRHKTARPPAAATQQHARGVAAVLGPTQGRLLLLRLAPPGRRRALLQARKHTQTEGGGPVSWWTPPSPPNHEADGYLGKKSRKKKGGIRDHSTRGVAWSRVGGGNFSARRGRGAWCRVGAARMLFGNKRRAIATGGGGGMGVAQPAAALAGDGAPVPVFSAPLPARVGTQELHGRSALVNRQCAQTHAPASCSLRVDDACAQTHAPTRPSPSR